MSTEINQFLSSLTAPNIEMEKILTQEANKFCADCDEPHPTWVSLTWGCFICANCASAHKLLGDHNSLLKSIKEDLITPEEMECLETQGNKLVNFVLEYEVGHTVNIPRGAKDRWQIRKSFIKRKYEDFEFIKMEGKSEKSLHRLTLLRESKQNNPKSVTQQPMFLSLVDVKIENIKFNSKMKVKLPINPVRVSAKIGKEKFKTNLKKPEEGLYRFGNNSMYTWNGSDTLKIKMYEKENFFKFSKVFAELRMNLNFLTSKSFKNGSKISFPLYNRDNKYFGSIEIEFIYTSLL